MDTQLEEQFANHQKWLSTAGDEGTRLSLDEMELSHLTSEQLALLENAFLTACRFKKMSFRRVDLYRTQMYSCSFEQSLMEAVHFTKSDLSYTTFTDVTFEENRFNRAEMYQCRFVRCIFKETSAAGLAIWDSPFEQVTFDHVDFDQAYFENILLKDVTFVEPIHLDQITELAINLGTLDQPQMLSREESIRWIKAHCITAR